MCLDASKENLCHPSYLNSYQEQLKGSSFEFRNPQRKRVAGTKHPRNKTKVLFVMLKRKMAMKNLKLYMQNQCIIEENERLRRKALLLHQENQVLFSHLQNVKINQQKQHNINTNVIAS